MICIQRLYMGKLPGALVFMQMMYFSTGVLLYIYFLIADLGNMRKVTLGHNDENDVHIYIRSLAFLP